MTLQLQIREDMKDAMRAREAEKVTTLRGLLSAFTNELIAQKRKPTEELEEENVLTVIKRAVKQRKDSIEQFTKGGRDELAQKEQTELEILEGYLPEGASKEEIENIVKVKIEELGITSVSQIGQLIGAVMKEFASPSNTLGQADGNDVKEVASKLLS